MGANIRNSCGRSPTTWNRLFLDETILTFYHQLLTLPALGAAGQPGLGDRGWERRWHGLNWRRGYRRRVDPLFVVEVCRVR